MNTLYILTINHSCHNNITFENFIEISLPIILLLHFIWSHILIWLSIDNNQLLVYTYNYKDKQSGINNKIYLMPCLHLFNRLYWLITAVLRSNTSDTRDIQRNQISFTKFSNSNARAGFPRLSLTFSQNVFSTSFSMTKYKEQYLLMQTYTGKVPQTDIKNKISLTPHSRWFNRLSWLFTAVIIP